MPIYIVNTSLVLYCYNGPYFNSAAFCPTWAINSSNVNPVDTYVEAGNCLSKFWDEIRQVVSENAFYYLNKWRPIAGGFPFDGDDDSQAINPQGTAPGVAPYYQAMLVKKMTGDPLRYEKGRAYIPYLGEEWAGATLLDPDDVRISQAALAFAGTYVDGATSLSPVKFDKATNSWEPVLSARMSQFLAFQRRRNMSHNYYEIL